MQFYVNDIEFDFDDEASLIDDIIYEIRCLFEDDYSEFYRAIYVDIYGCIRFDDKIYNYKDSSLNEDEWSISVLKEHFINDEDIGDIFNDESDAWFWCGTEGSHLIDLSEFFSN